MTLPKTLKVGPFEFQVELSDKLDEDCYGHLEYEKRKLSVLERLGNFDQHSTILHEALHAIDDCYGLELGERGVQCLETTLTQLIKDNPEWARELVSACTGEPLVTIGPIVIQDTLGDTAEGLRDYLKNA